MLREIIRKERRSQEKSQQWLADQIGLNVKTINQFEKGKQNLSEKNIKKVLEILGIDDLYHQKAK